MVSGLARCSFALRPARSLTPFGGACYTKGFGHFIASIPASATTGWSVSCRVGFLLSHWSSAPFHGAPKQALSNTGLMTNGWTWVASDLARHPPTNLWTFPFSGPAHYYRIVATHLPAAP